MWRSEGLYPASFSISQSSLVPLARGVVVFHVRGLHVEGRFAGGRQLLVRLHADCAGDGMTCRNEE